VRISWHRLARVARLLAALSAASFATFSAIAAPAVRPDDRVVNYVSVHAGPSSSSPTIGQLRPQQTAPLVSSLPGWYGIRLSDGTTGFVARGWTIVFDDQPSSPAPYRLHLIDVGTGLAVFVEGPGFTLLYDGGSNDDVADGANNRLVAYLRHARPDLVTIDHVILSHPHRDHVQLLPDVLTTYTVMNVWDSGIPNLICPYRAFLRIIRDRHIAYHDAHSTAGPHVVPFNSKPSCGQDGIAQTMTIPHADHLRRLEPVVLGPSARMTFLTDDAAQHASFNQNSLVILLELGAVRILFMGDAEAGGRKDPSKAPTPGSIEGRLLKCCSAQIRSDALVVGHHGSKTSSRRAFVTATGARIFLVSSGPTRYDDVTLPDPEVTSELDHLGTIYPTYENDAGCAVAPAKIGPDSDGEPGGCGNLVLSIGVSGQITPAWDRSGD
jgi:competence protein ComEC